MAVGRIGKGSRGRPHQTGAVIGHPMTITTQMRTNWAAMKANYDANPSAPTNVGGKMWKYYLSIYNTGSYQDAGGVGALLYQATGDPIYATAAWDKLVSNLFLFGTTDWKGNNIRESAIEMVVWYDWLYNALDAGQRATYEAELAEMFYSEDHNGDARYNDSDQITADYLGLALYHAVIGTGVPDTYWTNNSLKSLAVGGYDVTANDFSTMRNAVGRFIATLAEGGEWPESSEYNLGTPSLVIQGTQFLATALGIDHFPEMTAYVQQLALRQIFMVTPDLAQNFNWGDDENERASLTSRLWTWHKINAMCAGVLHADSTYGPPIHDLFLDLIDKYNMTSSLHEVGTREGYFYNPVATRGDRTLGGGMQGHYAAGQGMMWFRDGWGDDNSSAWMHIRPGSPGNRYVDHSVGTWGDIQLYRKQNFAITHPYGYSTLPTNNGFGINGIDFWGGYTTTSQEYRQVTGHEIGSHYAYLSGTAGGLMANAGDYDPAPAWLMEATRSILYLPSVDNAGASDTFVIFDRFNCKKPQDLTGFSGGFTFYYSSDNQTLINASARQRETFHMATSPSIASNVLTWTTDGSMSAKITNLLPASTTYTTIDESVDSRYTSTIDVSERKYSVEMTSASDVQWQPFLNVVQVYDTGSFANTLISNGDNTIRGVLVNRPSEKNVLVLFNAAQGSDIYAHSLNGSLRAVYDTRNPAILDVVRFRTTNYSGVSFTSTTSSTDIYFMDLDPTKVWSYALDGGGPVSLTTSSQGVATATISGSGAHTLAVTHA